jgi:hypothetical protein
MEVLIQRPPAHDMFFVCSISKLPVGSNSER